MASTYPQRYQYNALNDSYIDTVDGHEYPATSGLHIQRQQTESQRRAQQYARDQMNNINSGLGHTTINDPQKYETVAIPKTEPKKKDWMSHRSNHSNIFEKVKSEIKGWCGDVFKKEETVRIDSRPYINLASLWGT